MEEPESSPERQAQFEEALSNVVFHNATRLR